MRESMMQIIMLGLAALSCYGYFRRVEKFFSLRAEFAVFVTFTALGLLMLLAGIGHVLVPVIYAVFALGLVFAGWSFFRRESLRDFFQPGIVFLMLCCGAFFVLLYGARLTHVDNFSHWGAILKMIIQCGALPENEPLVYFPAYPTGSSLLIYYFVRIVGIQAEWFWAYIQAVYLSSCAATLFCFGRLKDKGASLGGFVLTAVMALALICGNIDVVDLLVDTLIPMVALAGVAMCIYYRDEIEKKLIPLTIVCVFLPMIKNSGYLFSAVLVIFALCLSKGIGRLRLPMLMGLSLLLMNRLWAGHVSRAFDGGMGSYHAMSAEALGGGFAEKTGEDLVNISRAFLDALVHDGRLAWLLLVLAAATLLLYKCGKWREFRGYVLAGAGIWLGWTVGMLAMYFTSMSVGEALRVAAFERYYASALVFGGGYFYILSMLAVEELCLEWKKLGIRFAGLVLCILLILPDFSYLVPQKMRPSPAYDIRCRFDNLVEQYDIPSGLNYIVFARGQNEIEARVICTYLLQPGSTLICADGKVQGIENDWGSFDYYIVLDEAGAVADFLTDKGKESLAGYIW